jgi:hypothetical protein
MNIWVYKNNSKNESYQGAYGDWQEFFDEDSSREWGRSRWFGLPSQRRVEQEMSVGDQVICHQTDLRAWIGTAQVVDLRPVGGDGVAIWLEPKSRFDPPLKVATIKKRFPAFHDVKAFEKTGQIETIYELSIDEQRLIELIVTSSTAGEN